jgi:hypothetical protein
MEQNIEASPICRGKNLSWETIMLFYNYMPKKAMPRDEFHEFVEQNINSWTQTHSQIARQLAFYYEEDGICYPRFTKESTLEDLFKYVTLWAHNYFIPNPYSPSLKGKEPTCIYSHIVKGIEEGSNNFDELLDSMFDVKLSSHDKVKVYLSNYTNLIFNGTEVKVNTTLKRCNKIFTPTTEAATKPKDFYLYFGANNLKKLAQDNQTEGPIYESYLTAIRTKPFLLLAGISGTGKSRIVRKLAQATDDIDAFANDAERFSCHSPANFCLIQVKPNWHNSMDVVGFKSNIGKEGEHYEYTPFIEFIGKAWQNLNTPFFLCLDEMNLAPVEEYFAEFLSAIESRSIDGNGSYETDPIIKPFKDFGKKVAYEMIEHLIGEKVEDIDQMSDLAKRLYYRGLTLPQNLIVMGTVNMDETTFSFSRKVLDRAMSIEMNEVSYDDFISGASENDIPTLTALNSLLVNRPIKAQSVKDEDSKEVIDFLKNINAILEGTPYKLGYRAANEALLYVASSKAFGNGSLASALDDFTLMKILSRIEGDDSKLKTAEGKDLLEELMDLLNNTFEDGVNSKSKAKLNQMINILRREHFVSFWG